MAPARKNRGKFLKTLVSELEIAPFPGQRRGAPPPSVQSAVDPLGPPLLGERSCDRHGRPLFPVIELLT
jgi:hypothetical protein